MKQYKRLIRSGAVLSLFLSLFASHTAFAAASTSVSVTLSPGWNIISTPKVLSSHSFSAPETLTNFAIYTLDPSHPSGWATLADLGQTEFTPLYGYFINNKTATSQVLTLNYNLNTTPLERSFSRHFTTPGWYVFGVAFPPAAKVVGSTTADINNPNLVLASLLSGATSNYDQAIDFTDAVANPFSVQVKDPWKTVTRSLNSSDITSMNAMRDFAETKGYAVHIVGDSTLTGYQNDIKQTGTLTLIKSPAYTDQTPTVPQTNYKIGEFKVVTGGSDVFTIGTIGLGILATPTTTAQLSNIYMVVGPTSTPAVAVGTSTFYWTGTGETFPANSTTTVAVYATLAPTIAPGSLISTLAIFSGTSQNTGDILATAVVEGQHSITGASSTATTTPPTPVIPVTSADFTGPTIPFSGTMDFQPTVPVWQKTLNLGSRAGLLSFIRFHQTGTASTSDLQNYKLLMDNLQVGAGTSIVDINGNVTFTFSPALVIAPASHKLQLSADLVSGGGKTFGFSLSQNDVSIADSINFATVTPTLNSGVFSPIVSGPVTINSTVGIPLVTVKKYTAYADQIVIPPQTAYKIGEFSVTSASTSVTTLSSIELSFSGNANYASMTDIYIVYGNKTSNVVAHGFADILFSVNQLFATNTPIDISVYATLPATLTAGQFVTPGISVGAQSGISTFVTNVVLGQTITISSGTLTVTTDASTPISSLVVGNTTPKIASFKFTALNDSYTITDLTTKVSSQSDASAITELVFKDGATDLAHQVMNGIFGDVHGLTIAVPSNGSKVIDVYANLGSIGTGFATSGANVRLTLMAFGATNSGGVSTSSLPFISGNNFYAYKTKPTITNVALPSTVLASGTQVISQFTITADAGGPIAWRRINFIDATSSGLVFMSGPSLYDAANLATPIAANCESNIGFISCSPLEQEVSGSKTYVLKADIGGVVSGSSISTKISSSGLTFSPPTNINFMPGSASFVWSDESSIPHSGTSSDWNNDFLVKNLPTDFQTLTK